MRVHVPRFIYIYFQPLHTDSCSVERAERGRRAERVRWTCSSACEHTYLHALHDIQIDTPGSERSEASERSESVGHVPVHAKIISEDFTLPFLITIGLSP